MQKITSTLLAILLLTLSACATTPPAGLDSDESATQIAEIVSQNLTAAVPPTVAATTTSSSTIELNTTYENAVSVEMQLLLGAFKLDGTENAVTKEQANILLPLWTDFKTLSQSMMPAQGSQGDPGQGQTNATPQPQTVDTETQAKVEALGKQIQAAMTPEQIQAISAMKITQETAMTIMQEQGITMGGPQANGSGNGNQPSLGTPPAGAPGGGGQPPADGQQPGGGQMSTPQADGVRGGAGLLPTELVDVLIKLLQSKAG
jgi:hypothetical protein